MSRRHGSHHCSDSRHGHGGHGRGRHDHDRRGCGGCGNCGNCGDCNNCGPGFYNPCGSINAGFPCAPLYYLNPNGLPMGFMTPFGPRVPKLFRFAFRPGGCPGPCLTGGGFGGCF